MRTPAHFFRNTRLLPGQYSAGSSVRSRIRSGTLALLALMLATGVYALPQVWQLGGAIRKILQINYTSIQAGQHMHRSLHRLQVAELKGDARPALKSSRDEFMYWMNLENNDITEVGEDKIAHQLDAGGKRLFAEIAAAPAGSHHDAEFDRLQALADDLIKVNQAAMFRDDRAAKRQGRDLVYGFALAFAVLLVLGIAVSWILGKSIVRPLDELVERLRGVGAREGHVRLSPQNLAELDIVAREFNRTAERLEQYDLLNVEKLVREQTKTEAIIESLEEGIILVDADGVVAHINESAALIMGIDQAQALGRRFDDLGDNHPHYVRVRNAVQLVGEEDSRRRAELQFHVRGRDHTYILTPTPLRRKDRALGTLLVLQDVTYLREQDRVRTDLIATLSHEIRTPVTSLTLCAQLLGREESLTPGQKELTQAIVEESKRLALLSDNLLNLARGQMPAIAMQRIRLNLAKIVEEVAKRFMLEAQQKHIALKTHIEQASEIPGDPVKLSWVISNLIGNALRYTPEGKSIEVTARSAGPAMAQLEVSDSGPGIAPEIRDRIFDRYTQYETEGHVPGSAGLGLAIAKEIVEAHSGRIFVESHDHRGSTFIVQLPTMQAA